MEASRLAAEAFRSISRKRRRFTRSLTSDSDTNLVLGALCRTLDSLIAGWTDFDGNEEAIRLIMAEWTYEHRDFSTRVDNLSGVGAGPRLNEGFFLKVEGPGATVFDDNSCDRLTGSSGTDWFIFNSDEDRVTDLSDDEFADALDFIFSEV